MPTELTDEMILQRFTQLQESNMNLIILQSVQQYIFCC